ncbi:response regulator [Cereibacter sphaeroides]|uniref:hybrid sensor histidine kinase/response regulator n=1 Tax=Cereibacter sphaeroides TaxID=1063 RepID=UPI001F27B544|nr:ATP-binding protein [Cereibacter sphaeroides]MCE6951831.1 response regulator [Cereibacter sphaeroides]
MGPQRDTETERSRAADTIWEKLRLPVAVLVVIASATAIIALAFDARQRFLGVDYAPTEAVERELVLFENGLVTLSAALATGPDSTPDAIREVLDRIGADLDRLNAAFAEAEVLWAPAYAEGLAQLRLFAEDAAPLTAADDDAVREATPWIAAALPDLQAALTRLSLQARADHEELNARNRAIIGNSLLRLVTLTGILVAVLSAGSLQLLRLYLRSREQADAARRAGARLEAVFRTSADAILVTDWNGRVLDCNRATLAIFGHPRERLCGIDAMDMLFPAEVKEAQKARVVEALRISDPRIDGPLRLELEAIHADGSRFPVEVSLAAARLDGEEIIVALLRDISARRGAEAELTDARDRALAGEQAKARFLAVMSHEMRTPLNGLAGSIELLAQTPLDPHQRKLVSVLRASAEILLDHVNSVLDIARSEARPSEAELADFDFDRLLDDCIANQAGWAAGSGNRLDRIDRSGPIGLLRGEPARLRQVLLNLLGNAVKFTRNGRILVETATIDDMLEVRVIDTGIGIPVEHHERIFEDFVTLDAGYDRRSGGTGLGLGIARRLARNMGGDISVTSAPGSGSRFTVRLPLRRPEAAPAQGAPEAEPSQDALSVLLIEDNDINRFIAQTFLESAGHHVVTARNGPEGLAAANDRRFDVVLTDIGMPGLDGLQVARLIRDGGGPSARSRILAVTAHSLAAAPEALERAGIDGCVEKPVGRDLLLRLLHGPPEPALPMVEQPIDTAQIRELRNQISAPALAALIRQMILDGDAILDRLQALGPDAAPEEVRRLAHQMAGAVSTFGTGPLHRRLRQLLEALRGEGPTAAHLAALPDLWQRTRAALAEEGRAMEADDTPLPPAQV